MITPPAGGLRPEVRIFFSNPRSRGRRSRRSFHVGRQPRLPVRQSGRLDGVFDDGQPEAVAQFGRRIDDAVFFVMTVLASVPSLLLLIALITVLGKGTLQVCFALGVASWVGFCRLARGETLKLREADYVAAARALGVSDFRIILRHILPNLAHLVIITFALTFTGLVLTETILSYLGVGIDGSWGQMIDQARNELSRTPIVWWNLAAAAVLLFTLVLAVNTIADAMRDIADPRTRRETQ